MAKKFKILTFEQFMDEHLNLSSEKLAYRNYVDNMHAANSIYMLQELLVNSVQSQGRLNLAHSECVSGLNELHSILLNRVEAHRKEILELHSYQTISTIIHVLTLTYIVLKALGVI